MEEPVNEIERADSPSPWQSLPQRAERVYMITGALAGAFFSLGGGLVPLLISDRPAWNKLIIAMLLVIVFAAIGIRWGRLRWRHTAWRLDETGLWVRRGRLFFSEILVPRSRVQHLDLERGPIERRFGLATLVVHTAGTRNHALRQSGFDEAEAITLRDALLPKAERDVDSL